MLKVIKSSGFATELFSVSSMYLPYPTWMGVGTNGKTYPDEMVYGYIKWGSEHSSEFTLVIADDLQVYNHIPFSRDGWNDLDELREKFRVIGRQRKATLQEWAQKNKMKNVKILRWEEIIAEIKAEFPSVDLDYFEQYFISSDKISDPNFQRRFIEIVEKQIPGFCRKLIAEDIDEVWGKFIASLYARQEIFLTSMLTLTKKAPIKIGHEGELVYDEFTKEIIGGQYGDWLTVPEKDNFFGAVYLGAGE